MSTIKNFWRKNFIFLLCVSLFIVCQRVTHGVDWETCKTLKPWRFLRKLVAAVLRFQMSSHCFDTENKNVVFRVMGKTEVVFDLDSTDGPYYIWFVCSILCFVMLCSFRFFSRWKEINFCLWCLQFFFFAMQIYVEIICN